MTDFNTLRIDLIRRLSLCGAWDGTLYWYKDTIQLLKKMMQFVPPKTNADRIRSMTDEELAKSITDDLCDRVCHSPLSCDGNCEIQVLDWLKQEAVDNGACSADETSEKVQEDE